MKRKDRNQRKEHVGRFFVNLMEKNIRQPGIPDCLIPVFANSVQATIGEEAYTQISSKIDRLLEFAEKKGFDYDQILASKPGKTIAAEILSVYNTETSSSSEKQLKNNLDETLVKNIESIENGQELNIEDTVNLAFNEFNKYLKAS
jgi:leucyl-tRNA synthetase